MNTRELLETVKKFHEIYGEDYVQDFDSVDSQIEAVKALIANEYDIEYHSFNYWKILVKK